jgi:hypothetical protein
MAVMASYEHLLKSYDVDDPLDEIASADPPAFLRRVLERDRPQDSDAAELEQLAGTLAAA